MKQSIHIFHFLPSVLTAPLKKIAFFFSEKQGEYSIWMIYVAVQGLHKSFLDVYPKVEEI